MNLSSERLGKVVLIALLVLLGRLPQETFACSTILVGKAATSDGSVLMSSSCDGDIMGLIYVMPARKYPPGTSTTTLQEIPVTFAYVLQFYTYRM
jgi:hypothetical protein